MQETLGKYGHGEDVDPAFARRRLTLVDEQWPRQKQDANRRADASRQPLANLAPHYCNNKNTRFFMIVVFKCLTLY